MFFLALISASAFLNLFSAAGERSVISSGSSILKANCLLESFVKITRIASCKDEKPMSEVTASAIFFRFWLIGT